MKIVKNAVMCTICGSAADRWPNMFQCQENPNHVADTFVGIFTDLSMKEKDEKLGRNDAK